MRYCIIILLCFLTQKFQAQNLVPNPSFEIYTNCPGNGGGEIGNAIPWYNPNQATPDYFNQCNTGSFGVPNNGWGNQNAKTGVAYSGIYTFGKFSPDGREYIQIPLTENLISNKEYCVLFYVSLGDLSNYAITEIGVYVSDTPVGSTNTSFLPYTPQIVSPVGFFISDKAGWTFISGRYTATGGEKYITIGNFKSGTDIDTLYVGGGRAWNFYLLLLY